MNKQAGFTLIELVLVIVILGILAATAIPKFVDLSDDARQAAIDGAKGAVQSAAVITFAQAKSAVSWTSIEANISNPNSDFTFSCANSGGNCLVTIDTNPTASGIAIGSRQTTVDASLCSGGGAGCP